jgi:hypothetical protein
VFIAAKKRTTLTPWNDGVTFGTLHLIICSAMKFPFGKILSSSAPLFEEEWHFGAAALVADRFHPLALD